MSVHTNLRYYSVEAQIIHKHLPCLFLSQAINSAILPVIYIAVILVIVNDPRWQDVAFFTVVDRND